MLIHMNVNIPPHPATPSYVVPGAGTSLYTYIYVYYVFSRETAKKHGYPPVLEVGQPGIEGAIQSREILQIKVLLGWASKQQQKQDGMICKR